MRSIRSTHPFFSYRDIGGQGRSNLSMRDVLRLVFTFTYISRTTVEKMKMTGNARQTIFEWHSLCHRVCGLWLDTRMKMSGNVQVDESFFGGRRKYGKGRKLVGGEYRSEQVSGDIVRRLLEDHGTENESPQSSEKANGLWVFCMYHDITTVRFVILPNGSGDTLIPNIKSYVELGSTIVSDEWGG